MPQERGSSSRILHLREHIDLSAFSYFVSEECTDLALHVSGYIPAQICQSLLERARQNETITFEHYDFAPQLQVTRTGMIYGEACLNQRKFDEYFSQATLTEDAIRRSFFRC